MQPMAFRFTYLPKEDLSTLVSNEEEADIDVALKSWCVVKLE